MYRIIALMAALFGATYGQLRPPVSRDYCVIGAGPSGLQLGHFLQKAGRDYVVFEKSNISGNFFVRYPRHNMLISINKRYTGKTNKEFNFRHDWNSLISDDESLLYKHYSKDFFPRKDTMLRYLDDYRTKLNINVQFNTEIRRIRRDNDTTAGTLMEDRNKNVYKCKTLVVSTGMSKPNIPDFEGYEHAIGYEDVNVDPDFYEGKSVLILGRGNAAFEMAQSIYGRTSVIHMVARSRVRLSWATHYVGDLRAVNNELLDTYQLKSLDAVLEAPVNEIKLVKGADNTFTVVLPEAEGEDEIDNFAMRESYDVVIRCLGFAFDDSLFNDEFKPPRPKGRRSKYPKINWDYNLWKVPGVYIAGTATHSLDLRKSAGGFIHGYRYTTRALHRVLEWTNHQVPWPSVRHSITQLMNTILKRINEASGIYQMFQVLGDVYIFRNGGTEFDVLTEVPINLLPKLFNKTGHTFDRMIVQVLEYGANFSGPGNDIFRLDRATGEPSDAHTSNFLHPVFYYYEKQPSGFGNTEQFRAYDLLQQVCDELDVLGLPVRYASNQDGVYPEPTLTYNLESDN